MNDYRSYIIKTLQLLILKQAAWIYVVVLAVKVSENVL